MSPAAIVLGAPPPTTPTTRAPSRPSSTTMTKREPDQQRLHRRVLRTAVDPDPDRGSGRLAGLSMPRSVRHSVVPDNPAAPGSPVAVRAVLGHGKRSAVAGVALVWWRPAPGHRCVDQGCGVPRSVRWAE